MFHASKGRETTIRKAGFRMNIDMIFRIAGIGVLVSVLGQVLTRTGREDMAMLTTLAGLAVVLLMVVGLISQLFQSVRSIFSL